MITLSGGGRGAEGITVPECRSNPQVKASASAETRRHTLVAASGVARREDSCGATGRPRAGRKALSSANAGYVSEGIA